MTTNLVVADKSRTEKTICLAVSPPLKAYGIAGRARLFEVIQKVRQANAARLRAAMPDLVIRTSLICGLPGETDEEFEELCDFLREQKLQRAGVFQFSPEEGTPAAEVEDQVDPDVARRRVELLVELQSRVMDHWNEQRLGETMEVLCEGFDASAGCYAGRTYADSVDVDNHVYFTAAGLIPAGEFVNVRITGTQDGDLTGEIEE